jgi:hypothetical protein
MFLFAENATGGGSISLMDVFTLIGGLALFLYGMNVMSAALEKSAGNKLKSMSAGKMGYSTSEVGDLIVENL